MTKLQRLTIILTVFNLILLAFGLVQLRPALAQEVVPVLRARALEIVDDQGRVRAEISSAVEAATSRVRRTARARRTVGRSIRPRSKNAPVAYSLM